MVQIKGLLRSVGLLVREFDYDTETSEESATAPENRNIARLGVICAPDSIMQNLSSQEFTSAISSEMALEISSSPSEASLSSDSEATMTQNKRNKIKKRKAEAALTAEKIAPQHGESREDVVATHLGDLEVDDFRSSSPTDSDLDLLTNNLKAETMESIKPRKKNRKERKKPGPSNVISSPVSDTTVTATTATKQVSLATRPHFGFDEYRDELKCRRHGCGKLTNCFDGDTVICPRCGARSFLRYCSLSCLLDPDMRFHWAQECERCPLLSSQFQVDDTTLIIRPSPLRPYISCPARDNPARHRQAIHHSANSLAGDYFVFNDYTLIPQDDRGHVGVIGAGEIIATVIILPDYGLYQGQSIFYEVLEDCLRVGHVRTDKCLALVDMVTRNLVSSGQWNLNVQQCLIFQMKNEFAYDIPHEMLLRFRTVAPASVEIVG